MQSARLALYQAIVTGPVLGLLVVTLLLTRPRVLGHVRAASWVGLVGWWLLGALPWLLAALIGSFWIAGTNLFWRAVLAAFNVLVPFGLFALPLFAAGATGVWIHARMQRPSKSD